MIDAQSMAQLGQFEAPTNIPFGLHCRYYSAEDLGLKPNDTTKAPIVTTTTTQNTTTTSSAFSSRPSAIAAAASRWLMAYFCRRQKNISTLHKDI